MSGLRKGDGVEPENEKVAVYLRVSGATEALIPVFEDVGGHWIFKEWRKHADDFVGDPLLDHEWEV